MGSQVVTLDLPDEVSAAIEQTGQQAGRDFASVASEMLTEAVRMRRFPGIVFGDGKYGRAARLAGTDVEVPDVIATYNRFGRNRKRLREAYPQLGEQHLNLALEYWRTYRKEVERQLDDELRHAVEAIWAKYPMTRPRPTW